MGFSDRFCPVQGVSNRSERGIGITKRKGVRELNSLCCSINYDRVKEQEERLLAGKGGREFEGDSLCSK